MWNSRGGGAIEHGHHFLEQLGIVLGTAQTYLIGRFVQHAYQHAEDVEVNLCGIAWNHERENEIDAAVVRRVEVDGLRQAQESRKGPLALHAAVGDRYPVTQTGAAEAFAREQLAKETPGIHVGISLGNDPSGLLKRRFPGSGVHVGSRAAGMED